MKYPPERRDMWFYFDTSKGEKCYYFRSYDLSNFKNIVRHLASHVLINNLKTVYKTGKLTYRNKRLTVLNIMV